MAEIGYPDLVDFHGSLRNQALSAFRLIPELAGLNDAELLTKVWPAWQHLVADLLDASDCPNCLGKGELDEQPNEIPCPTCDGDGWLFGRIFNDQIKPPRNPGLPPATTTNSPRDRPSRQPELDAASIPNR